MKAISVRLPKDILERLSGESRRTGLSMAHLVRERLESALAKDDERSWMRYAGVIKGGPSDVSSRKGFSQK